MAKYTNITLLGFQDEPITDKHTGQINYTVNKIGGEPDFVVNFPKSDASFTCNLCQLPIKLVVQVYAPLEGSKYHRTLYLFACINPNCWNRSESWKCFRAQTEEDSTKSNDGAVSAIKVDTSGWCSEADDWGENDNASVNLFLDEENFNVINNDNERESDEESGSLEDSIQSNLRNVCIDDKNANNGAQGEAMGRQHSPGATAEIEGNEGEVITIETPTVPKVNLVALLNEANPLPQPLEKANNVPFVSYFMSVWEEEESSSFSLGSDSHARKLLTNYQQKNPDFNSSRQHPNRINNSGASVDGDDGGMEEYERAKPAHGDLMSHHFISTIQTNPGQILRYNREGVPLFIHPPQEPVRSCVYCRGEMVFEFQLLPTLIPKLWLSCDTKRVTRLEFGNVLVYACKQSCWTSNDRIKEEYVMVQKETL